MMRLQRSVRGDHRLLPMRILASLGLAAAAACGAPQMGPVQVDESVPLMRSPEVSLAAHHDQSPPLTLITPAARPDRFVEHPVKMLPRPHSTLSPSQRDPVQQSSVPVLLAPIVGVNFDGIGNGVAGFTVASAPPDTNGDVGLNHYVQTVNSDYAVYNKSGTLLFGPVALNTLWSGFGGLCQTDNDGDPVVLYDRTADRWVISQFAVTGADGVGTPYLECVAVSTTGDPTGSFNRYSFSYNGFDDYPKMSTWPDGYYTTFNMFNAAGTAFLGAKVCAYDRSAMVAGTTATQQCFDLGTSFGGVLSADRDGANAPPAGAPNYLLALGANANQLAFWKFHVDWTTPTNSTLTGPTTIATAAFSGMCPTVSREVCIAQAGTTQKLEALSDRLMFRLAYRNFGDHEALIANHTVQAGASSGIRWYEIRNPATTPTIFQQSTYAPDGNYRWVGSVAMDKSGNIGLGYSVSGNVSPQIHYTGRLATDASGTMTQGENTIVNGAGSQTGQNLARWGDYSMMSVDPVDDCTFWYTTEYIPSNGAFNWKTRIGSFSLPGCGGAPPANDFSISANPGSLTLGPNASGTSTIATTVVSGSGTVNLSVSGTPSGATATLNPTAVAAGSSSTLTVNSGTAAPGSYSLTITGTEGSVTHATSVALTVTSPGGSGITNGGFETGNFSGWTTAGTTAIVSAGAHSGTYAAQVGGTSPTNGDSSATQTFTAPTGAANLTFWYQVHCPDTITYDWATATLKDNAAGTTATVLGKVCSNTGTWNQVSTPVTAGKSYTLTLISHDDNYAGDPTYTLYDDVAISVSGPPPNDFSISAGPTSLTLLQGTSGTSTISTALTTGSAGTVSLTVSGTPSGATASLSPTSVTAGGSSTLTVGAGTAAAGNYTLTVTGTEGSITHSTTVALTVTAPSDFSVSASPTSVSVVQGGSGTSAISTAITAGAATTVSLTTAGAPAGTSATLNPTSVTSGGGSTLTISVGASTAVGTYTITVTGTGAGKTHSATVALTVTTPVTGGIVNGGFETGNFSGWTLSGASNAVVSSGCHSGTYCARSGTTVPTNGDSSVTQVFTVPTGKSQLSVWYASTCPDSVTYDWVTITLKDNAAGTTATLLAPVCDPSGSWKNVVGSVTAGKSYTLTLTNRDDNYTGDPTYTLFDDVTLN